MTGYKLSDIVDEKLIEMGEGQGNKFSRFYQYGLSFLRQKNLTTIGFPKITELTMSAADTAPLPLDYLQYTRIGLCINGCIYSLGRNENLCLNPLFDSCGNPIAHRTTPLNNNNIDNNDIGFVFGTQIADNWTNGEFMGRMFGIGSDNNSLGYYRIDKNNHQIQFSNVTQSCSVILEYIADISAANGDFDVHPFAVEACKDWMFWKYKVNTSKPLGETAMAREDYNNSSRLMRMQFASGTIDEWIAVFQSANQQTPKL